MVVQTLIGAMALELRAHKREPYMWTSVANAVLSLVFMLLFVHYWGITGEAMGYALAILVVFFPCYKIYRFKHLEFRKETGDLQSPQPPLDGGFP